MKGYNKRKRKGEFYVLKSTSLYFSPTKTTEQVVTTLSHAFDQPVRKTNLTSKVNREKSYEFSASNLTIIGVPVHASHIPKIMETYFITLEDNNTSTVIITVYGNRDSNDVTQIDAENCLHCCQCIQIYPTQAKKFDHPFIKGLVNQLIDHCGDVRKNLNCLFKNINMNMNTNKLQKHQSH